MEETKYPDDERWAICVWLYLRKPFPAHLPMDAGLYADIVQTPCRLLLIWAASGALILFGRCWRRVLSDLTQERVVDELRVLDVRQPDDWAAPPCRYSAAPCLGVRGFKYRCV